jgi:predicted permease
MTRQGLVRRLRALFSRHAVERELTDEVHFHLQMEIDDLVQSRGLPRAEAARQARVRFGGVDRHTESHRDARGVRLIEDSIADLRYAARALRRTPAFTISTVLVLALGIGASTAIFSAVNAVLISRLPYPDDSRLVRIYNENSPTNKWPLSVVDFQAIDAQQRTMTGVGAMIVRQVPISAGGGDAVSTVTTPISAGMFTVLGIRAAVGRVIERPDEAQSAPPVVVLADAFARRTFGSPASAVGKSIDLDGSPRTVVGVLPPGVNNIAGFKTEIMPSYQPRTPTRRGPFGIVAVGRMKDGMTLDATRADLASIGQRVFPLWRSGFNDSLARYTPISLRTVVIRDAPKTLWMFAAAAALLLLTAVTNVTNLMLARMTTRTREISLRAVLGASSSRLVRLIVAETTLLAAVGAACGVAFAWGFLRVLIVIANTMPRLGTATIDGRAMLFATGVALLTGLVIGVHPVLTLTRKEPATNLSGGNREIGQGSRATRLRGALVTVEFALALPLLVGAGQLMDSITRLQRVDPGFDPSHIGYLAVVLPSARYDSAARTAGYWRRAMADASSVPGVVAVGYSTELPPSDVGNTNNFTVAETPIAAGGVEPTSPWMIVSPSYFDAMGARLLEGRRFSAGDTGVVNALIVTNSWAKRYSPGRPAIGRRVFEGGCTATTCPPMYIVGIVTDMKYQGLSENGEAAYMPSTEGMSRSGFLMIRTSGAPSSVLPRIRAALRAIDPAVPIDDMATMDDRVYNTTAAPRHWAMLLGGFAIAALALAAIGTFGLLSYLVTMMWREIGVRVALGAQRQEIARMIVTRGLTHSAIGAAAGLVIALVGRRLLAASLYQANAGDPMTLAAVTVALLLVALLASWIPARRAARIDPMAAMRAD